MRPIYLDYNATTPVDPRVVEAMRPYLREHFGNPSSDHVVGQQAKTAVENARAEVAALIGAQPAEIVFTGCATEANNLALLGVARALLSGKRRTLLVSAIEHPSVAQPMRHLSNTGWNVVEIPVDATARIDASALEISSDTALVSVMLANNEVGTIQPIRAIADKARLAGALMHVDAAQAAGKIAVGVDELGCDLLTLAGPSSTRPRVLARCMCVQARPSNLSSTVLGTSAACAPAPRTCRTSWPWARRRVWCAKNWRRNRPASGRCAMRCISVWWPPFPGWY